MEGGNKMKEAALEQSRLNYIWEPIARSRCHSSLYITERTLSVFPYPMVQKKDPNKS